MEIRKLVFYQWHMTWEGKLTGLCVLFPLCCANNKYKSLTTYPNGSFGKWIEILFMCSYHFSVFLCIPDVLRLRFTCSWCSSLHSENWAPPCVCVNTPLWYMLKAAAESSLWFRAATECDLGKCTPSCHHAAQPFKRRAALLIGTQATQGGNGLGQP